MTWQVLEADCVEAMRGMEDNSVDAVVTDPPAGISFMQRDWDHHKGGRDAWVAWLTSVLAECLRVAKPGAHALIWALPRTSHWTGWAIENAGWEVRDRIAHHFGSGFPKSLDVSKAIDKAAGVDREVVGEGPFASRRPNGSQGAVAYNSSQDGSMAEQGHSLTAPATPEAQRWQGWGTSLKPATEDWWLCRKPLVGTVAQNVERFGTGALNIDGCRIESDGGHKRGFVGAAPGRNVYGDRPRLQEGFQATDADGRWPANVCLSHIGPDENGEGGCERVGERRVKGSRIDKPYDGDVRLGYQGGAPGRPARGVGDEDGLETVADWRCVEGCPVRELDLQSGDLHGSGNKSDQGVGTDRDYNASSFHVSYAGRANRDYGSQGGSASRFFYVAKSSRAERTAGVGANAHPT